MFLGFFTLALWGVLESFMIFCGFLGIYRLTSSVIGHLFTFLGWKISSSGLYLGNCEPSVKAAFLKYRRATWVHQRIDNRGHLGLCDLQDIYHVKSSLRWQPALIQAGECISRVCPRSKGTQILFWSVVVLRQQGFIPVAWTDSMFLVIRSVGFALFGVMILQWCACCEPCESSYLRSFESISRLAVVSSS